METTPSAPAAAPVRDIAWSAAPYVVFSGFAMGTADVVPGVSGGTMAVAMGVYRQLLVGIASVSLTTLRDLLRGRLAAAWAGVHWRFLLCLVSGIGLGVALMVKVVRLPELIVRQPKYVYAVFFGLVLASAIVLARRIPAWPAARSAGLVLGIGLGFAVVNLVPVDTPDAAWFLFVSGLVAICAMVLPGISGSFMLLILGKYAFVLSALARLDLSVIVPFAVGCLVGITTFSRLLAWTLARWHDTVLAALVGLLIGSLWRIWPYQRVVTIVVRDKPRAIGAQPFLPSHLELGVLALFAAGFGLIWVIEGIAARRGRGDV
jgi:putative membrane protein